MSARHCRRLSSKRCQTLTCCVVDIVTYCSVLTLRACCRVCPCNRLLWCQTPCKWLPAKRLQQYTHSCWHRRLEKSVPWWELRESIPVNWKSCLWAECRDIESVGVDGQRRPESAMSSIAIIRQVRRCLAAQRLEDQYTSLKTTRCFTGNQCKRDRTGEMWFRQKSRRRVLDPLHAQTSCPTSCPWCRKVVHCNWKVPPITVSNYWNLLYLMFVYISLHSFFWLKFWPLVLWL